jgi:DNA-dependent RNA polymerase auxiliary subunit epsilon
MENTDTYQYFKQESNTVTPVREQSLYYVATAIDSKLFIRFIG